MNFRKSRITDHNQYEQTDHLYDPLRNTLRRRSISKDKDQFNAVSRIYELKGSSISRVIREIDPNEAQQLQQLIYIPADKQLKATKNYEKIKGKHFMAVDINEKVNPSITEQEFQLRQSRSSPNIEHIVYEIASENSKLVSPKNSPYLLQASGRAEYYLGNKQAFTRQGQKNGGWYTGVYVGIKEWSNPQLSSNKTETMERNHGRDPAYEHENFMRGSNTNSNNYNDYGVSPYPNVKKYEYSARGKTGTGSRVSRPKSEYKYNLFSALDEPVNTKCGRCGPNEIITVAPHLYPWS